MNSNFTWKLFSVFCLTAVLMMVPELSYASSTGANIIGDTLCTIVNQLTGKIGRGIATLGVIFLGIGLFVGKLSWGLAVAIAIGIGGIFGAESIVDWLDSGANNSDTCNP